MTNLLNLNPPAFNEPPQDLVLCHLFNLDEPTPGTLHVRDEEKFARLRLVKPLNADPSTRAHRNGRSLSVRHHTASHSRRFRSQAARCKAREVRVGIGAMTNDDPGADNVADAASRG